MNADFDKISSFTKWNRVRCKNVGWFYNPDAEIPKEHVDLFSLSKPDLKSGNAKKVIIKELERFCTVDGLELSRPDRNLNENFMEALTNLPELSLIKYVKPRPTQPFINYLEKLNNLDTLIINGVISASKKEDYSRLNSIKRIFASKGGKIEDPSRMPPNIHTLIIYRGNNLEPDTELIHSLKKLPNLKKVHLINAKIASTYGGLNSESPFINGTPYEENWSRLKSEFPTTYFSFDVNMKYFDLNN